MRPLRILLVAVAGLAALGAAGLAVAWLLTAPEALPEASESANMQVLTQHPPRFMIGSSSSPSPWTPEVYPIPPERVLG